MSRYWLVLLLLGGVGGRAADIWFGNEGSGVGADTSASMMLLQGSEFAEVESAVAPESVTRVMGRLAGKEMTLGALVAKETALEFRFVWPGAGLAVVAVELKTQLREIAEDAVERHLRRIHADEKLWAWWNEKPRPRRWRESAVQTAKAIVRRGDSPAGERSWAEPAGLSLEFVPERDPTVLRVGDELTVRVLRMGQPQPNFVITYVSEDEDHEHVVITDETGRAGAVLNVSGRWLLRGIDLQPATGGDFEWESVSTTLGVTVK